VTRPTGRPAGWRAGGAGLRYLWLIHRQHPLVCPPVVVPAFSEALRHVVRAAVAAVGLGAAVGTTISIRPNHMPLSFLVQDGDSQNSKLVADRIGSVEVTRALRTYAPRKKLVDAAHFDRGRVALHALVVMWHERRTPGTLPAMWHPGTLPAATPAAALATALAAVVAAVALATIAPARIVAVPTALATVTKVGALAMAAATPIVATIVAVATVVTVAAVTAAVALAKAAAVNVLTLAIAATVNVLTLAIAAAAATGAIESVGEATGATSRAATALKFPARPTVIGSRAGRSALVAFAVAPRESLGRIATVVALGISLAPVPLAPAPLIVAVVLLILVVPPMSYRLRLLVVVSTAQASERSDLEKRLSRGI
jgi:hypothetical protein